jgi:pteridine reductase
MQDRPLAIVTGGSARVGRAIVTTLAQRGFDVIFTYNRSQSAAEELAGQLNVSCVRADFSDDSSRWSRTILDAAGDRAVTLLVNNASYYASDEHARTKGSLDDFYKINCAAPRELTQLLAPALVRAGGACVINMLDILAQRPMASFSAYCASKAALWNVTLAHAKQFAPHVRVNGIAPGVVDWPAEMSQADREKYLSRVPLRRAGTPQDVAELVHFLATAGTYITGQVIALDGGRSIV